MQYTTNYNLKKPEYGDNANIADINYNSDSIDNIMHDINNRLGNGYQILSGYASGTVTFSKAFAEPPVFVATSTRYSNAGTYNLTVLNINYVSTTMADIYQWTSGNASWTPCLFHWIAYGKAVT